MKNTQNKKRRNLIWQCGPVFGCPRVEETGSGMIVISNTKTKKEIRFTKEEFEELKQAIKSGKL